MKSETSTFELFKIYVEQLIPLDRDYLHVLVGAALLVLYLLWKIVKRRQFRGYEVAGIALIVAILAELMDIRDDVNVQRPPDYLESAKDAVLTVSVPGIVAIGQIIIQRASRFRRRIGL